MVPSDSEQLPLVEAMGRGDADALQLFIERVGPWVHAAQLRLTGTTVAAAVLTEDTLTELWATSPCYDRHFGPPMTWALAVARAHGMAWVDKRRGKEKRLKSKPDAVDLLQDCGEADPRARAALDALSAEDQALLEEAWTQGLPGGEQGAARRARFDLALRELARVLAEPGTEVT